MKKILSYLITYCFCSVSSSQIIFSIGTDLSILRQVSPNQKFWSIGQTVQTNFHFTNKESAYAWISYYTNGKFKNNFTATAKNTTTIPSQINYTVRSSMRYRHFSLGWKHFFKGSFENEDGYNLYYLAGFGMLLGKIENIADRSIDTSTYTLPQKSVAGTANFKRLTFDAGIGCEIPLGPGFFAYAELRTWLPASDYPSPYLYNNQIPKVILVNGGLRILID